MSPTKKVPSPVVSLFLIIILIEMLLATIRTFGSDALNGGSQVSLPATTAVCIFTGIIFYRIPWEDYEMATTNNIASVPSATIILLIIGMLGGARMISGVIPTLIYYGMKIIHPDFFLTSTCIICALVLTMTGSSWTITATIGIALLGIGRAQGFEEGWIAGIVISGAYFSDKVSPLPDITVLTSSATDTSLLHHIRYMVITTISSFVITPIIFMVMGFMYEISDTKQIVEFAASLNSRPHIALWLLIVPMATGTLITRKMPSIITLLLSTLLVATSAIILRSDLLYKTSGNNGLFKGTITSLYDSTSLQSDSVVLIELIATRDMVGMMNTIRLILCAMCFGGAMTASGMLGSIASVFVRFMKSTVSVVTSTAGSGLFLNLVTVDQYISIILTGNMFSSIYEKKGYESRLLSYITEDAVIVTSVFTPWNTCGMIQVTILNVSTLIYLPYCFFNLISPLVSTPIAAIGYKIIKETVDNLG